MTRAYKTHAPDL